MRAHLWKILLVLLLVLGIVGYFRYYWVFGTGAKAGELNYMVHKGVLFKTYEGKMIQTGIRTQSGSFQSLEFLFSVGGSRGGQGAHGEQWQPVQPALQGIRWCVALARHERVCGG